MENRGERFNINSFTIKGTSTGMRPLTESEIVSAFPKKERKHLRLPDLSSIPWDNIDFLGWEHPSGHLGFVVYERDDHLLTATLRRSPTVNAGIVKSCSWCNTLHPGNSVVLYTTESIVRDNTDLGDYICRDLQCSLYSRRILLPATPQIYETVDLDRRIYNLRSKIDIFFQKKYGHL